MTHSTDLRVLLLLEGGEHPTVPGALGWSGFIRFWAPAMAALKEQGVDLVFGTIRERSPLHPIAEELGIRTFALDCAASRHYPRGSMRLARVIREQRIAVLHLSGQVGGAIGGMAGFMARRGARLFHRHHVRFQGPPAVLSRIGSRLADLTMAVSDASARGAVEDDRVSKDRVVVVHQGIVAPEKVDPSEVAGARASLGLSDDQRLIVTVGHLRPEKGHRVAVRALKALAEFGYDDAHLALVGSGSEERMIRTEAEQAGIADRVHLLGHQEDVSLWYEAGDAVILPSIEESFGKVAIEAMAVGRPLIASRVGGIPEIVTNGVDGILVEPGDAEGIARAVSDVFGDPEMATRLTTQGQETFRRRFTLDAMIKGWLSAYERALALAIKH